MIDRDIPKPSAVFGPKREAVPQADVIQPVDMQISTGVQNEESERQPGHEILRFTRGVVKFVHPEKGFGFCTAVNSGTDTSVDVFFHMNGFFDDPTSTGNDDKPLGRPMLRKGDTIALSEINYHTRYLPTRPGAEVTVVHEKPYTDSWTTVTHAESIERAREDIAKKYPFGIYYYPPHETFSKEAGIYFLDHTTGEMGQTIMNLGQNRVPGLAFVVGQPGEYPSGFNERETSKFWNYFHSDQLYRYRGLPIVEGAAALGRYIAEALSISYNTRDTWVAIVEDLKADKLQYRLAGDKLEVRAGGNIMTCSFGSAMGDDGGQPRHGRDSVHEITESGQSSDALTLIGGGWFRHFIGSSRSQLAWDSDITELRIPGHDRLVALILEGAQKQLDICVQKIPRLERIAESCASAKESASYRLIQHASERQALDEEVVASVVAQHQTEIAHQYTEIAALERCMNWVENIEVSDETITIGNAVLPIHDHEVQAKKPWISFDGSDGGMYTLAARPCGGGSALLGGIAKEEFRERYDEDDRAITDLIFDDLVDYFVRTPQVTSETEDGLKKVVYETVDSALSRCSANISERTERIRIISDLMSSGQTYKTMYDLEVAFNERWRQRAARKIGSAARRYSI
ncbi:MAG: hypothetical protein WAT17_03310 [Candidatus Saccharimonadales bacterium]